MSRKERDVFNWPEFMEALGVIGWAALALFGIIGGIIEVVQS